MRRDVVGLGVVLAVSGLAYGSSRGLPATAVPVAPMAAIAMVHDPERAARPSARFTRPRSPRFSPREAGGSIAAFVREAATRHGVPEPLVAAVISVESEFNPRAISHRGALGLMQLMPGTAALLGVRDAFDPRENVDAGARHLRDLLDRFANDVPLALAAYNAGPQAVLKHGGVPPYPETRAFIARVLRRAGHVRMPAAAVAHAAPASPVAPRVRLARHTVDRLRAIEGPAAPEPIVIEAAVAGAAVVPVTVSSAPAPAPTPAAVEVTFVPALARSEAP